MTDAAEAPRRRIGWRRQLKRLAVMLTLAYLVVGALLFCFQRYIVFPGRLAPRVAFDPGPRARLTTLTTDDASRARFAALFRPHRDPAAPTLVLYYGNGDNLAKFDPIAQWLGSAGFHVCTIEYPGYPLSEGTPSRAAILGTVAPTFAWLAEQPEFDARRVVLGGVSLGTGVAAEVAATRTPRGLVLFSPYTRLSAMARVRAPVYPTGLMLLDEFEVERSVAALPASVPVVVFHGTEDRVIPPRMSRAVAAARPSAKVRFVEGAGHNDLFLKIGAPLDAALRELRAAAMAGE